MKRTLAYVTCFLVFTSGFCYAGDKGSPQFSGHSGYLKKDPISENRVKIYDKNGSLEGYTKKDPISADRWNIYDSKGRQKGSVKQDPLSEDRKNIYDKDGHQDGYLKKGPLFEDRIEENFRGFSLLIKSNEPLTAEVYTDRICERRREEETDEKAS
jgi:hypothetical protein